MIRSSLGDVDCRASQSNVVRVVAESRSSVSVGYAKEIIVYHGADLFLSMKAATNVSNSKRIRLVPPHWRVIKGLVSANRSIDVSWQENMAIGAGDMYVDSGVGDSGEEYLQS